MGLVTKGANDSHQYPLCMQDFISDLEQLVGVEAVGKGRWAPYSSNGFKADVNYLNETERTIKVVAQHKGFKMDLYVRMEDVDRYLTPVLHYIWNYE